MSEDSVRVAIVGAGYMAEEHIKAFQAIPGATVAGIHSRTRARAESLAAKYKIATISDSIEDLHRVTRADIVVVAVPELSMLGASIAAFQFPWTVLIEKPAGHTLVIAEKIAAAADRHGSAYVALNRRFYSSTQAVLDDLKQNTGTRFIHVQDQEDQISARASGQPEEVIQHWMYANSVHLIDFFSLFGRGEVTSVQPTVRWNRGESSLVTASIEFSSGDRGLYQAIWNGPGPWAVQVSTPSIRWELRPIEQASYQRSGERKLTAIEITSNDRTYKPGLFLQAQHTVFAATKKSHNLVSVSEALETTRLTNKIYEI